MQSILADVGLSRIPGIAVALFGASGVFGQLQDALNTIWGVKSKPGRSFASFLRARFLSFAMVAGVCFLLLVSLMASAVITALGGNFEHCSAAAARWRGPSIWHWISASSPPLRDDLQVST